MQPYLSILFIVLSLSACTLDRSGLAGMPGGELSATPALACPGDTVVIAWDTERPPHPSFCRFANGNLPELQRCSSGRDCPIGGSICLDGYCNLCSAIADEQERRSECAAPSHLGCQPDLNARIRVTPEPMPPLAAAEDIAQHRGERTFVVRETSDIAFRSEVADPEGNRAGHPDWLGRIDLNARVEVVDPDLLRTAANAYECRGRASWPGALLEELFPGASSRLRLLSVHNPSRFAVDGSIDGNPLHLEPGATLELSLVPEGPIQAQPAAEFLRTLPPVQCTPTFSSGSYPGAPLLLRVGCVAP
ncbi:hypothetical protein AAFN46_13765 [Pseudomonas sp. CAU 1711]|uniref:hypothetical protein n=1 Tax=Pseudomonas sp. CAU 1711 TaxID=3140356 RepID=UPI0032619562